MLISLAGELNQALDPQFLPSQLIFQLLMDNLLLDHPSDLCGHIEIFFDSHLMDITQPTSFIDVCQDFECGKT